MIDNAPQHDPVEIDEGSWVYVSATDAEKHSHQDLVEQVTKACARSGWRTVSHPISERVGRAVDPGRFFAGVSYAVESADVVVTLIGAGTEMADAELTLAYSHGRPVVGVQVGGAPLDSEARMLLREYERGRVVTCDSPAECGVALQEALADPAFAEIIRQAR